MIAYINTLWAILFNNKYNMKLETHPQIIWYTQQHVPVTGGLVFKAVKFHEN